MTTASEFINMTVTIPVWQLILSLLFCFFYGVKIVEFIRKRYR